LGLPAAELSSFNVNVTLGALYIGTYYMYSSCRCFSHRFYRSPPIDFVGVLELCFALWS
jgi:hypothetical protein